LKSRVNHVSQREGGDSNGSLFASHSPVFRR